jgi:quercetin dioxygenase-like cupin family protein
LKTRIGCLAPIFLFALPLFAQDAPVITMDQEPHHHLALRNGYVKVFKVEVSPGDSIVLHRHDQDTVAIAVGEQLVTVGIPGKPDVHQKNADAQVRLQRSGYVHSTRVDGVTPYHTVAVELMHPQTSFHNVCAEILAGQPLDCPAPPAKPSSAYTSQLLLQSDQTLVALTRVLPHQSMKRGKSPAISIIIALDAASISTGSSKQPDKTLKPGDFVWIDRRSNSGTVYRNGTDKETRFIEIIFRPGK